MLFVSLFEIKYVRNITGATVFGKYSTTTTTTRAATSVELKMDRNIGSVTQSHLQLLSSSIYGCVYTKSGCLKNQINESRISRKLLFLWIRIVSSFMWSIFETSCYVVACEESLRSLTCSKLLPRFPQYEKPKISTCMENPLNQLSNKTNSLLSNLYNNLIFLIIIIEFDLRLLYPRFSDGRLTQLLHQQNKFRCLEQLIWHVTIPHLFLKPVIPHFPKNENR